MPGSGTIQHRFHSTVPDDGLPGDIGPNVWNDSLVVTGGTDGDIFVRDSTKGDGWAWTNTPTVAALGIGAPAGANAIYVFVPSTTPILFAPSDIITDNSKFASPPLRLRVTYDSSPAVGTVTPASLDFDLVHVVASQGPTSYASFRFPGTEPLRVTSGGLLRVTSTAVGQSIFAVAIGTSGELPQEWAFSIRSLGGPTPHDFVFEDGSSTEAWDVRAGSLFMNIARGLAVANASGGTGRTLTVFRAAGQTGEQIWAQTEGGIPLLDLTYNGVLLLGNNSNTDLALGGLGLINAIRFDKMVDPAAPAANRALLYARDNGAGKVQLVVVFNTGAVQVLATQP